MTKQLEYTTGGVTVVSKELTEFIPGKVRLLNHQDVLEFLTYSISQLIAGMATLQEAIDSLRSDIRQIRVGNEAFVYGETVADSDEVDPEDLEQDGEE